MTTLNNLIKRDVTKYYYVIGEENENKIHFRFAGNFFERKQDIILYFDDIKAYTNTVNKSDILNGELEMIFYKLGNGTKISFYAILDKKEKILDYSISLKCHFEVRIYNSLNCETKILKKIDLFESNENIIYLLSSIIGEYV